MDEEIRDTFFCKLYDKDMLQKICMQFQDRVPSLSEIVLGAEGIEAYLTAIKVTHAKPVVNSTTTNQLAV